MHGLGPFGVTHRHRFERHTCTFVVDALGHVVGNLGERHALLLHRVTLANRHGLVIKSVEVDGDAQRGADLVLSTIAAADRTGFVVVDHPVIETQILREVLGHRLQFRLLAQR